MTDSFDHFRSAIDEKTCLCVMMKVRQGGTENKCPACGRRSIFEPNVKHRAYICGGCGHSIYPCEGTPLAALRTPLVHWFYAIKALVEHGPDQIARRLERDAGISRQAARRMERELQEVAGDTRSLWPDWLVAVGASVTVPLSQGAAPAAKVALPVGLPSASAPASPVKSRDAAKAGDAQAGPAAKTAQTANSGHAIKAGQASKARATAKTGHVAPATTSAGSPARRGEALVAAPREHPFLVPILAAAMVLGLVLAGGVAFYGWKAPSGERAASDVAELALAPAHPSLILSAVEEDLEAAREAVEFALENDTSLALQEQLPQPDDQAELQPDVQPEGEVPQQPVVIPSIRLPLGTPLRPLPGQPAQPVQPVVPRQPLGPPMVANGDPNQILTFGPIKIRRHIVDTIVRAARVVGADPSLLMAVADKESSFATEVKAKTSSATGLYQFIESTWLGVVYEFGAKHGLKERASITKVGRQFVVSDPAERERILELRREPYLSALLAGEMLKRDTLRLEKSLGRHLTGGEIYLIHFLGPDAAETFIDKMDDQPNLAAAELLPKPAQANRPIFYSSADGQTKTLSVAEVHRKFDEMIKVRLDRYRIVKGGPPPVAVRMPPL